MEGMRKDDREEIGEVWVGFLGSTYREKMRCIEKIWMRIRNRIGSA